MYEVMVSVGVKDVTCCYLSGCGPVGFKGGGIIWGGYG